MDPSQYYITTLSNAASKIGPLIAYALVGYFIFIKLPFLIALKSQKENRNQNKDDSAPEKSAPTSFQEKIKIEKTFKRVKEEPKKEKIEKEEKQEKTEQKKSSTHKLNAYDIFDFNADEKFTKIELKKRYYELLRQNHPDKVASLSSDLKKLAEKKTKDINTAYDELKKKAS